MSALNVNNIKIKDKMCAWELELYKINDMYNPLIGRQVRMV